MVGYSQRRAGNVITSIPWDMIAPHEKQALVNHDQTLERLAQRGGLEAVEAMKVLRGEKLFPFEPDPEGNAKLRALVAEWESSKGTVRTTRAAGLPCAPAASRRARTSTR